MKARLRFLGIWALLLASSGVLAGLATLLVYQEHRRQEARRSRVLEEESARLLGRIDDYFQTIRMEAGRQLVGFHEEGLESRLRRWQSNNPLIAQVGVEAASEQESARFNHAAERIFLEDPDTPSELRGGYYEENRDYAAYRGLSIEPLLAWRLEENPLGDASWTVAHRLGPDSPTRFAALDSEALALSFASLAEELSGAGLATRIERDSRDADSDRTLPLSSVLPGRQLALELEEEGGPWVARLGYGLVALCLGLGGACALLIWRQLGRERSEARRKTTFVSQISHELRTPLTSITLYADLLGDSSLPQEKRTQYLDTISRESQRLTGMIDNLLSFSSLERGKQRYAIEAVDLVAFLSKLRCDYQPTLSRFGMRIDWNPPPQPALALVDAAALRQCLLNLMDNARKYAADGARVEIALRRRSEHWQVLVSDRGPGIPKALAERVFEPFFQRGKRLSDRSPGAGLGLSIARMMLRGCAGELSLDSTYKQGARFVVRLPQADSAADDAAAPAKPQPLSP